jgi:YHS domain-containing protein
MKDRLFNRASARRCVARLCVAVGLVIAAASHAEAGIPWHENLVAAKSASVASQRPLLVIFTAAWSEDSDRFLQTTLSSPEAVGVVCACFEAVRLDVDMNPELARRLRVTHLPTACVIDANEQLLFQFECSASSADFVAYAARAVQHAAAAKQAARPVSVPAAASAAAPLVGGPVASFNPAPTFAPAPAVSAPPQPAYTADRGFGQPTPGGATPAPGYPTYQGYAVAPPPVAPAALPTVAAVPAPGVGVSSYPTTTFPAPAVPPAAEPAAEKAPARKPLVAFWESTTALFKRSADEQEPAPQPAANVPTPQPVNLDPPRVAAAAPPVTPPPAAVTTMPMGMEGYCPVTLMEKGAWVEGNVQYGARHRGRTYLFAGAAEQQAFFASPDRYAPVLSGDDPVLAMDAGQRVAGDRRYGLTYESRTYLFSSPDTLNAFTAAPEVYARRVTVAENAPRIESGTILR